MRYQFPSLPKAVTIKKKKALKKIHEYLTFTMDHVNRFIGTVSVDNYTNSIFLDIKLTVQYLKSILNTNLHCKKTYKIIQEQMQSIMNKLLFIA